MPVSDKHSGLLLRVYFTTFRGVFEMLELLVLHVINTLAFY
jgi:hypothetical protein